MRNRTSLVLVLGMLIIAFGEASAADYFVSAEGDDASLGTSPSKAFKTPERAMEVLKEGDSLYFRSGDAFFLSKPIRVQISGKERNPVIIGAYPRGTQEDSGNVFRVPVDRPILDGGKTVPEKGSYLGIIHVTGKHVEIRDLVIRNSGGIGVRFHETSYGTITNVLTDWSYFYGIQFYRSNNVAMIDCEIVAFGQGGKFFDVPFFPNGASIRSSSSVLVKGSIVREGWGEGINTFFGSSDVTIEDNIVYAVRNIGIYVDSTVTAVIRNNIVLGTTNSLYHRSTGFVGPGIAINNEKYQFRTDVGGTGQGSLNLDAIARDIRIYNNLVAFTSIGLAFFGQMDATHYTDFIITHNTFVDNRSQISAPNEIPFYNSIIANNVFYSISSDSEDVRARIDSPGVQFTSNYWSQGEPPKTMIGDGDIYSGLNLVKRDGWRNIGNVSEISPTDFRADSRGTVGGAAGVWIPLVSDEDFFGFSRQEPADVGSFNLGDELPRPQAPGIHRVD